MLRLRYLPLLILPLAIRPLTACESSTNTGPGLDPDGGAVVTPTQETGPLPNGGVTVRIQGSNGPRSGVLVVFHGSDGSILETKTTGADGAAWSSSVTLPAMASALVTHDTRRNIVTWTGLEAGDQLALNDPDLEGERGSFDVSLAAPFQTASYYTAAVGHCGTTGTNWNGQAPRNLPLRAPCVRAQNAVLVRAIDTNNDLLASAFVKNVAAPGATPLAVSVGAFAASTNVTVSRTNASDGYGFYNMSEIVGGVAYQSYSLGDDGESATFQTATGFAEALQASAYIEAGSGAALSMVRRLPSPAPAGGITFDFTGALPVITEGTTDVGDPRRPAATWTSAAPLSGADGGLIQFQQYIGNETLLSWTIVVPPGAMSVKAPALPAEADAWFPSPDAGPLQAPYLNVMFFESDQIPNYATFRAQNGMLFESSSFDVAPALPSDGTLRVARWGNAG